MKRFFSIIGILLSMFAGAVNWSIVNTALPVIQDHFNTSVTNIQWLMNFFGVCLVPFLVTMGRVADLYGRKRLYVIGTLLFTIPSFFGGLAQSIFSLILWRGLQGFASAIILPISQALVVQEFAKKHRGRAIGLWMLTVGLGAGLGPFIGGLLIDAFSWRAVFFFNLPFTILSFFLCLIFTKESKDEHSAKNLDPWGNLLLICLLMTLIVAIVQGPDWGWGSWEIISLFILSGVSAIAFYFVEMHSKNPIIEFHLYLNQKFLCASLGAFYVIFYLWGAFFLFPIYLQNILRYSPPKTGTVLLMVTIPFAILAPIVGYLESKMRPKYFVLSGLVLFTLSTICSLQFTDHTSLSLIAASFILYGIGWACMFGPSITAGISALPDNKTGIAAGSLNTMQEIGGSLGLALMGTVLRNTGENYVFAKIKELGLSFSTEQLHTVKKFLSNPDKALFSLNLQNSRLAQELLDILNTGFLKGFYMALYLVLGLSLVSFLIILFALKKPLHPNKEPNVENRIFTRT